MEVSKPLARHYVMENGVLVAKASPQQYKCEPKTITYNHTVRFLSSGLCGHEEEIEELKKKHKLEAEMKDCEITGLKHLIQLKDKEIQKKQEQIEAYKFFSSLKDVNISEEKVSCLEEFDQPLSVDFQLQPKKQKGKENRSLKQSRIGSRENDEISQKLNGVSREMANTENALKNITNMINSKHVRKYSFFTKGLQNNSNQIDQSKCLDQTCNANQTSHIRSEQNHNSDLIDEGNSSSENESKDTCQFFEETIHEHLHLKKALVELQQKTSYEIEHLKEYYENEIQYSIEQLEAERQKSDHFRLNSTQIGELEDNDFGEMEIGICTSELLFEQEDQEEELLG